MGFLAPGVTEKIDKRHSPIRIPFKTKLLGLAVRVRVRVSYPNTNPNPNSYPNTNPNPNS